MADEDPEARPLVVVDGDALMHRAYHGVRPLQGADGREIGALYGFVSMLLGLWDALGPRAIVVARDSREPGHRNELYPPYQAQREPFDAAIVEQLDDLPALLAGFAIAAPMLPRLEADDILATLAAREEARGGRSLVITHDRDAYQVVSDRTTVLRPSSGVQELERVDPAGVVERYGVEPAQVPDLIALRGDPSDGIPGARGIGQKTAAELLRRYGGLEGVIAHADELTPARAGAVRDAADALRVFRRIAVMLRDLPVEPPADGQPDWLGGASACRERGIGRLADRIAARAG